MAACRDAFDAVLRDRGLRRTTPQDTAESLRRGALASAGLEDDSPHTLAATTAMAAELLGLLPVWRSAPLQALARIHALAAAGAVPDDQVGRPVSAGGAERLQSLAHALNEPTAAPALAVAALVHGRILTASAFASHNGVVARAAERLVLVARGVDPASVTVPEAGHGADPAGYAAAAAALSGDSPGGTVQWLMYCARAYQHGIEASPLVRTTW